MWAGKTISALSSFDKPTSSAANADKSVRADEKREREKTKPTISIVLNTTDQLLTTGWTYNSFIIG